MSRIVSENSQDYLISRLKNPEYAALYLETHLEEEEDADPELLRLAFSNVFEALSQNHLSASEAELLQQTLDGLLSNSGAHTIYHLAQWLKVLGLKLTVNAESSAN